MGSPLQGGRREEGIPSAIVLPIRGTRTPTSKMRGGLRHLVHRPAVVDLLVVEVALGETTLEAVVVVPVTLSGEGDNPWVGLPMESFNNSPLPSLGWPTCRSVS